MVMTNRKLNVFMGILITLALALSFAGPVTAEEKVLIYGRPTNAPMDPGGGSLAESSQQIGSVYDPLTQYTLNGEVIPGLVESWEISPDYKEYILHLRKGVKFHDGTPFNAQAVKFTLDRILRVKRIASGSYMKVGLEDGCTVIDDHTIKIHLKESFPLFIKDMSSPGAYAMMSPTYVNKHATTDDPDALKWMNDHACGTGPFKLVDVVAGQQMVFEKNDDYWGGGSPEGRTPAKVDKMIFQVIKDPSTARLMLERGDVDMIEKLQAEQLEALEKNPDIKVEAYPVPKIVYITMDVSKAPFDDVKVRQAIACAINYDEILEQVEKGYAKRLHGMIPSEFPSSNPNIGYSFDLEKAKALIKASGYPDGFSTDLYFASERRSEFELYSLYIQAYLKKIGIDVNIKKVAFPTQLAKMGSGNYGMSLMCWGPSWDPLSQLAWLGDMERGAGGGWNASFFYNDTVEQNLRQASQMADLPKRKAMFQTADNILMEQAIYVPICELSEIFAMRKNIVNFHYNVISRTHFWLAEKH